MKLKEYIKDKSYAFFLFLLFLFLFSLFLFAFKLDLSFILILLMLYIIFFFLLFIIDFLRKKVFYQKLLSWTTSLDKSYLVLELLEEPNFYEGRILYQVLYEINKSMIENIGIYEQQTIDFKEYVEMWIHEIKIPISSLVLMNHNHKGKFPVEAIQQIKRIENDVEQVLYYVRSENAEKDYLINEVSLKKVVSEVALRNKDDLLENKVDFIVDINETKVLTDSKWLEFILNQIINNSIKYKKDQGDSYIHLSIKETEKEVTLEIKDNGIGIVTSDLKKVFEKSFTGQNGRKKAKSTGMGLFIVKRLCEKLGHQVNISSVLDEYTKVTIIFLKNHYYDVLK